MDKDYDNFLWLTMFHFPVTKVVIVFILEIEDYFKEWAKHSVFFHSNSFPFNGQNYQKQKGPGTSDQSFRL